MVVRSQMSIREVAPQSRPVPRERGYVLIALMLALVFLLGMCGLAVDLGRMYITKSEAQSFVDSAALAAAQKLDGSSEGLAAALTAVSNDPKRWRFDNTSFSGEQVTFATDPGGPWVSAPPAPAGYRYARVQVSVDLPMYLIRILSGPSSTIGAAAIAGWTATTLLPNGVFPFSPYTRKQAPDDASDPYGFQVGNQYTFRWGAPGTRTNCGTDETMQTLDANGNVRGYCCAGNASSIRAAIVGGDTDPISLAPNTPVPMDNGAKNTEMVASAIADRVNGDTDPDATTYEEYLANGIGNGKRVVVVPVNGGGPNFFVQGLAGFFLLPAANYRKLNGNDPACAEYVGVWVQGVPTPQPGGSGAYHLKLYQ